MENSRDKQFLSFKLHAVLMSMTRPHTLGLLPAQIPNHQHSLFLISNHRHCHSWMIKDHPKEMILLRPNPQISSRLMLCYLSHFILSCRCLTISHHHKKGEYSTRRNFWEREREGGRPRSHNFYSNKLLLLFYVITAVVNLFLGLVYKLNFIIGVYI